MMFSLRLATVAAAILLLGNSISGMSLQKPMAKPCCSPDKWESSIGYMMGGNSPYYSGYGKVAYDYTSRLLAVNQTFITTSSKVVRQRMLLNGKARKMYFLDEVTGRCTISTMPSDIQRQCVPSNFNYTTTITLGEPSSRVNALVFDANMAGYNISLSMTQKMCAPLSQILRQGNNFNLESFFNFTTGIMDRSVFNIPPGCKAASSEQDDLVASLIMRHARSISVAQPCTSMFSHCWFAQRMQL